MDDQNVVDIDMKGAISNAGFNTTPRVTDIWWPREELYRESKEKEEEDAESGEDDQGENEQEG